MNSMFPALALLAALPLAACGQSEPPPLAGAKIGGPFALTNGDGKTVRDTDFAGKYRIVYFGYTYCPDVCPTDMQKIGQALRILDKDAPKTAAKLATVFITVDPERDTPAKVKQFTAAFHPGIVGLTGSPAAIAQVAKEYAVYYKKQKPGPGGGYMVDHVALAYLMGPDGAPIASLPTDKDGPAIAEQVRHWVQ
jgi:protein SCO1